MVASEFDADTDVQRLAPGAYRVQLTDRWSIGPAPNGGYLLAAVLKALGDALPHPDVLSATAHYLRPTSPSEADIEVEAIRAGRRLSTAQARLSQDGFERVRVLATFTDLSGSGRPQQVAGGPPALPPPEACLAGDGRMPRDDVRVAIAERFDLRLHPDTVGWAQDGDHRRRLAAVARERHDRGVLAEVGGWIRLADGRDPDLSLMAVVVDALPPTAFDLGASGWIPTVELTLHGRARPAPGWLRCWITSRFLTGGWIEEDAQVWDSTDSLVAASRQLARVPRLPQGSNADATTTSHLPFLHPRYIEAMTSARMELIAERRDEILRVAVRNGASNVRVFGSVARGEDTAESDVDLLVDMEAGRSLLDHVRLVRELRETLGVNVDVVSSRALRDSDGHILAEALPL